MDVNEEYIVVPTFKMIGEIGGTLGIFIGFAFLPYVTQMLEFCKYFIYLIYGKFIASKIQSNYTVESFNLFYPDSFRKE